MTLTHKDLLDAGVHFGHLSRKWHPNMAPYIFMKRNGIHIIDLNKTISSLQNAAEALKALASADKKILFVATKKQARAVVERQAQHLGMPYITERWLGGTLTNFATIRKLLKKMSSFDKMMKSATYQHMAKKEQLMITRANAKLAHLLHGIADVTKIPAAIFVVDLKKEHIAAQEAKKLGLPIFALTDTNTDPTWVDYPIPSNDDSSRSVEIIMKAVGSAIEEGLEESKKQQSEALKSSKPRGAGTLVSTTDMTSQENALKTAARQARSTKDPSKSAQRMDQTANTQTKPTSSTRPGNA